MIELLRRAAARAADHPAVVTDEGITSYGDLLARAEAIAASLQRRGITRLGLLDDDAATVLAVLGGASLAGVEVCQYPPADEGLELAELAESFDHRVIVTNHAEPSFDGEPIDPDELTGDGASTREPPASRPLLILTTGTTGMPRGVRHDWGRMLRAARRIPPTPEQRWLLAYGLHQFAGLQVIVHVMAAGATLVAPAPRRPHEGLMAMRTHSADHASATPTYWRFLLAELRADGGPVPQLAQITLGGEAIPGALLTELTAVFPTARISQVYAASEFGSTGSTRDGRSGLPIAVLDRDDDADIAMKIVDGELWVRSRTGMVGYYGEDPVDPDAWQPTGDLVEIVGDRIRFRGRSAEIINVGGVKVHPLPIEERVGAVHGVDMARVYGRPNSLTGAIVAVEVVAAPRYDTDLIVQAIGDACADLPTAARPRSIRFVEDVVMAGDKIRRRDLDERTQSGHS